MTIWKPIDSAPMDGAKVLLYDPTWCGGVIETGRAFDGGWFCADIPKGEIFPTHWMPLPEPPQ